jgi:ELWxxDGT repeat protein
MKVDFSSYSAVFRYLAVGPLVAFGLLSILATGENEEDSGTVPLPTVSSQLAFRASDGMVGAELWKSDGTAAGTALVKDINETGMGVGSYPSKFTVFNGALYFSADDGIAGGELWKSDGTAAGTVMVKDINNIDGSDPSELTVFNGALYFSADDGTGRKLWKSDGIPELDGGTTERVKDIKVGTLTSELSGLTVFMDALYFSADDGANGFELWKSDGTAAGTVMVKDINPNTPGKSSNPSGFTVFGDALYFSAGDGVHSFELWKSDGVPVSDGGTTVMVADINPGTNASNPSGFTVFGDALYFSAGDGVHSFELWKSDGVPVSDGGTTVMVADINPGTNASNPSGFTVFGDALYFSAGDGNGAELWKSDGTAAGTQRVKDINTNGTDGSNPSGFTVFNGALYFSANDGNGAELWKSDGVPVSDGGTTEPVADINTGGGSDPSGFTVFNDALYFSADDGNGAELWKSDGVPVSDGGTTEPVADINTGGGSDPSELTVF